ncbi:MAG: hypothetical protein EOP48_09050 [Sphingobacteriales bacterium]|nr:MAG: hypothetical protein EOP48_09050 [Sphingobacteriales bacterium]
MRQLLLSVGLLVLMHAGYSQTFLESFRKYRWQIADTISNRKTRTIVKRFIKSDIIELDTVFKKFKVQTDFDFNATDTIFIIYNAPAESLFTRDVIIWSGEDTIAYRQCFKTVKPFKQKRIIVLSQALERDFMAKELRRFTETDSLIALVSKRDFKTINQLGVHQTVNDGSYYSIYVAFKNNGRYIIESCFPKQFAIFDTYQIH